MNCDNLKNYFNLSMYKPFLHRKSEDTRSYKHLRIIINSNRDAFYELNIIMDISKITY